MIAAHARPKPTKASVWTFIIAVLSPHPSGAIASSGCWQHLWVVEANVFSVERVPTGCVIVPRCRVGIHPAVRRCLSSWSRMSVSKRADARWNWYSSMRFLRSNVVLGGIPRTLDRRLSLIRVPLDQVVERQFHSPRL
jgi:hypothetical protein